MHTLRDTQLKLFDKANLNQVVNVASVVHRSPFRYPGGKTWLVPYVFDWLIHKSKRPQKFIEPFAGGGIIGLSVAFENLADQIILVELDDQVSAVWQTIFNGDYLALAERIRTFDLTPENIDQALAVNNPSTADLAFQTILRNRINRGGILAPGVGRLKYGEGGKGISSRWYPETLSKRIQDIGKIRHLITFIHGDGLKTIEAYTQDPDAVFFIDPPYTAAGKKAGARLYTHYNLDHEYLFNLAANIQGDFLITYDNAEGVKEIAAHHNFKTDLVAMKNTHHSEMFELLIRPA